jgi:purine catabolism regulator
VFFADVEDRVVVVAGSADPLRLATRLPALRIGVSDPVDYARVAAGYRQATQAADAAVRDDRPVARFADLAGTALLDLLPPEPARAFAEALLANVIRHDDEHGGDLVDSLRVWLTHFGQWDPAAAHIGVHRHTLRNRMRRVEQLTGRGLDSPGFRAELWLALQLLPPKTQ